MEFNINGNVSLEDYIQICKSYQKRGFIGKYNQIIFFIVFIVFSFMYLPSIKVMEEMLKESPMDLIKVFIPLIIAFFFVIMFHTVGMNAFYKKQYEANRDMHKNQNIKIGNTWISITTDAGTVTLYKPHIKRIIYLKDAICIYEEKIKGYIIKKSFMKNEADFDDLVKFIKENYGYD